MNASSAPAKPEGGLYPTMLSIVGSKFTRIANQAMGSNICISALYRHKHKIKCGIDMLVDAAVTIWKTEGPSAFYHDLLLGLLGVTVQFPLHDSEQLKLLSCKYHLFLLGTFLTP